jgi:single-strand DNA-binding protein
MNGIEAAFTAKVVSEPENRIAASSGNPWMRFSVSIGEGDDAQFCNVAVFGDVAAKLSGHIAKLSKVYCEGRLKLDRWEKDGQQRSGLSLAAWRCDPIGQIGKNKPSREKSEEPEQRPGRQVESYGANPYKRQEPRHPVGAAFKAKEPEFEPHRREKPKIPGLNDDFRDELPF